MRRRALLAATGGAAALRAFVGGRARAAEPALVAVVFPGAPPAHAHMLAAFRRALAQTGQIEGRDLALAVHYLDGDFARLPALAEAVVAARPRVIVAAPSSTIAGLRHATATIPIVMATGGDPVAAGFAASLARPGGNVTGLSNQSVELVEKQFELVPELLPQARRVIGLRGAPASALGERMGAAFAGAAERFGLSARMVTLDGSAEIEPLRAATAADPADALFIFADPITFARRRAISGLSTAARLPVIAPFREFVELGALASYGASLLWSWERTAWFVDRILKGAKPAELPIEQPTTFELVVNLGAARALGVAIPPLVLARADEVIE